MPLLLHCRKNVAFSDAYMVLRNRNIRCSFSRKPQLCMRKTLYASAVFVLWDKRDEGDISIRLHNILGGLPDTDPIPAWCKQARAALHADLPCFDPYFQSCGEIRLDVGGVWGYDGKKCADARRVADDPSAGECS